MNPTDFSVILKWVLAHGYPLIFLATLIEGPIVTATAAFAAALGYFNPVLIFVISIAGDLFADVAYYAIGYYGRTKFIDRFGRYFGITPQRLLQVEKLLQKNSLKVMLILKLTPILPTPGLIIVGSTKMPLKKFTLLSLLISLPKSLLFFFAGYYFGQAYDSISKYVTYGSWFGAVIIILIIILSIIYKKVGAHLARKIV